MGHDPRPRSRQPGAALPPLFVIQGEYDFTTPTDQARRYLDSVTAPHEEFVTIEGAGHFAVFMKSERFLDELVRRVRPLAASPRPAP